MISHEVTSHVGNITLVASKSQEKIVNKRKVTQPKIDRPTSSRHYTGVFGDSVYGLQDRVKSSFAERYGERMHSNNDKSSYRNGVTTRSIGVLSHGPGQPTHVQSRMDTRRSKGSTNMSQEMYDR